MSELNTVYLLTNPAMPGLVKIGYTAQAEVKTRVAQLYSTGVPVPFEIAFAATVEKAEDVERALQTAFAPYRINPKREFFKIDPEQATAILRLLEKEDATDVVSRQAEQVDSESLAAGVQLRRRRPNLNFEEMGIPVDATLGFARGGSTVTVVSDKKVKLGDNEMSLTSATRELLGVEYDVAPRVYWTYNGRLLSEIYEETYESGQ